MILGRDLLHQISCIASLSATALRQNVCWGLERTREKEDRLSAMENSVHASQRVVNSSRVHPLLSESEPPSSEMCKAIQLCHLPFTRLRRLSFYMMCRFVPSIRPPMAASNCVTETHHYQNCNNSPKLRPYEYCSRGTLELLGWWLRLVTKITRYALSLC